ncbi:MAG: ClpXP protease specificity-enhancing factor [Burkholderiaceae bacterium]
MSEISTKPYLLRAIHEWCSDSGYTPYIAVTVDNQTVVPTEFVRAGEIVLNISLSATNRLTIGNDLIEFQARFGGVGQDLSIPIENVSAIYARENGHGMAFDVPKAPAVTTDDSADDDVSAAESDAENPAGENAANVAPKPARGEKSRPSLAAVPKLQPLEVVPDADQPSSETNPGPEDDGGGDAPPEPPGSPPAKRRGKPNLTRVK